MLSDAYTLVAFEYDSVLYPVSSSPINFGINEMLNGGNASIAPELIAMQYQDGVISLTSPAIKSCLDKFITSVYHSFHMASGKTTKLYYALRTAAGAIQSSNAVIITVNEGDFYVRRISARYKSEATIQIELHVLGDGTNAPFVYSTGSVPTDAILQEKFTLGPVSLNGALIEVQGWDYDTGYSIFKDGSNGLPYPSFSAIERQEPTISVDTYDLAQLGVIGTIGSTLTYSGVFLRKYDMDDGRVADDATTNISIAFRNTWWKPGSLQGGWRNTSKLGLVGRPYFDGTNAVDVIDTTADIAIMAAA